MRTIASVFSDVRQATSLSGYSLHTKQSGQGHVGCGNTMSEETIKEGFTALCYTSIDLSKLGWASMICGFLFLFTSHLPQPPFSAIAHRAKLLSKIIWHDNRGSQ
jgi:hypothetical protein